MVDALTTTVRNICILILYYWKFVSLTVSSSNSALVIMQNNPTAFQDAVARAREIAQKLSASAPNSNSLKRPNSDDDVANKRPAFASSNPALDASTPVLRAQLIAQQINSQLGVKASSDSTPLSNQLTYQEDYKIPDKFVGLVIGKGGEQIVRLQQESGCKVQISQTRPDPAPGGPNPPDRLANLSGTREAIERAKRIMDEIITKGRMADGGSGNVNPYSMGGANSKTLDVMLPSAKCGLVIGKGGETIKRLSEEFNVKMYVVQETTDIDGIEHKPLRIMGDPDRVERAKQYVLESLLKTGGIPNSGNRSGGNQSGSSSFNEYGSRSGGAPMTGPCNEATYHVPYEKAGIIIGKGGENIKEINRKSGAFVELDKSHVPQTGNVSERVFKLRGTPDQIVKAQQLMYEKVANSAGGSGDMLTPILFQQQFNLPLVGSNPVDGWNGSSDPYGNGANNNDPYSQWSNAFGQWPQMNAYDQSSSTNSGDSSSTNNSSAMAGMDPAWIAYYQQMSYYNMMQSGMTGTTSSGTSTSTTTTKATDSTAGTSDTSSTAAAVNPTTGQADYSQQWVEYYRAMGQHEYADEIAKQMKQSSSTTTNSFSTTPATDTTQASAMMMGSGPSSWAAYAQQWANAAMSNSTNGNNSSSVSTS
ncbi:unnamed protein product [Adineta ricciae]|uniref:K Homology domain-containing protein n=1 Tax=Adineta ricciae TaxID=249248 RepID=A0A815S972_ADIRI|nr:unnamed protein product [Adineta ricciae]